jgi:hypothetical protein
MSAFNPLRGTMALPPDCAILTDFDWSPLPGAIQQMNEDRRCGEKRRGVKQAKKHRSPHTRKGNTTHDADKRW